MLHARSICNISNHLCTKNDWSYFQTCLCNKFLMTVINFDNFLENRVLFGVTLGQNIWDLWAAPHLCFFHFFCLELILMIPSLASGDSYFSTSPDDLKTILSQSCRASAYIISNHSSCTPGPWDNVLATFYVKLWYFTLCCDSCDTLLCFPTTLHSHITALKAVYPSSVSSRPTMFKLTFTGQGC